MAKGVLFWLANASYRQWQIIKLLVLGAIFTFLGGFAAFGRFSTQMLAEYYLMNGEAASQTPAGQKALRQAAQLQPHWARAHLSLAQAYYGDNWYDGAIQEAQQAFRLTEDSTDKSFAASLIGFSYLALSRNEEALDALKLAVELNPDNAKAQQTLQQLQQKLPGSS
ncbi:hypothetical protein [Gloeobacter kilaueensis]|uniref:Cytochrome c biogenesis factor n=1 Tax=Gloeobacter kilaueensis (strain ATCC BAA-2537 / CCAP 1431/1 / ULC 316 / JS1) TaxID=1183438 RepID=U5QMD0_GLOK1|nr:hypothetical protein [Gloeobacter kilaueensis]AGY60076.1 cytochrome c biogenesis factor [Gloeobacter kilaueensis JS1]